VLKIRDAIAGSDVTFQHRDYRKWLTDCDQPHVIYCDPPYDGSLHDYKPGAFNTEEFWEQAREWSESGHSVFVSEYVAPDGWIPIWEGAKRQSLIVGSSPRDIRTERLFMWNTPETKVSEYDRV
jgi:site-specific DNA-adenine methylase